MSKHIAASIASVSKSADPPEGSDTVFTVSDGEATPFYFYTVDEAWQREGCTTLDLQFIHGNKLSPGSPTTPLTAPNRTTIRKILGDGNCLFHSFSYLITGTEDQHMAVRLAILDHLKKIEHLILRRLIACPQYQSAMDYITATKMNDNGTWGTDVEIYALAHMLQTCVFLYCPLQGGVWNRYTPDLTTSFQGDLQKGMYLNHSLVTSK